MLFLVQIIIDMGKTVVFFDLECTSISFNPDNVRIVEIAAIKVDLDTFEEVDRLYFKCNNGDIHIAKDAYEVHGISEDDVKDLPTFNDRAKEVFDFINGYDIGGYNCAFYDIPILYSSFLRAGLNWNYRTLNVYDVYLNYKHHNSGKLAEVYKKYTGKDLDNAHHYSMNLYFESAAMIVTLVSVGKYLEGLSKKQTSLAIEESDIILFVVDGKEEPIVIRKTKGKNQAS